MTTSMSNHIALAEAHLTEQERKLFLELKQCLLQQHKELPNEEFYAYYYTILKQKSYFSEIVDDCDNYEHEIYFNRNYNDNSYSYNHLGDIVIFINNGSVNPLRYEIELNTVDRMWGYCFCKPEDEGYDARYRCVGTVGCDDYFPKITIERRETLAVSEFDGDSKLKWDLKDEWMTVSLEEKNSQEKNARVKDYQEKIAFYQNLLNEEMK